MRILHYMFGLPPVRGGGLVRYALDLMEGELSAGEEVSLLVPGRLPWDRGRKTKIYRAKNDSWAVAYAGQRHGHPDTAGRIQEDGQIDVYAVYNPQPVPMGNGILAIDAFTKPCEGKAYGAFLGKLKPDLIHIHTFMGLHREFLEEARKQKLPVLFTTHDYFGLCPTASLMLAGRPCGDKEWAHCGLCCQQAYSKTRLCIEHAGLYRHYRKQDWLVRLAHHGALRKIFRFLMAPRAADACAGKGCGVGDCTGKGCGVGDCAGKGCGAGDCTGKGCEIGDCPGRDYVKLKNYYKDMFRLVTYFHFNSSIAEGIYRERLGDIAGSAVPITHAAVRDSRERRRYGRTLRLGYLGGWTRHKGFDMLLCACAQLYEEGCQDLELHVYSDTDTRGERFVKTHPKFTQGQLPTVFQEMDVLLMPSRWPETFGFVALEAISHGVPVILSETVGAKDLLAQNPGIGFVYGTELPQLKETIRKVYLDRNLLAQANRAILAMGHTFSHEAHVEKMLGLYQDVLSRFSMDFCMGQA